MQSMPARRPQLALALQGGGAHGAYGWGALDRLLSEDVDIVAVSGASAGALNGAALVAGMTQGGKEGARAGLEALWTEVALRSPLSTFDLPWLPAGLVEPFVRSSLVLGKTFGSYLSPLIPGLRDMETLRSIVEETIDLAAVRDAAIPFHVSATRIADGSARLFGRAEVTLDALMASACLPDIFAAVTIDGEDYWDGGYSANPALEPLVFADAATDLLVVQITPFDVGRVGTSAQAIMTRISDIGFNACLMRDLDRLTQLQAALRNLPPVDGPLRTLGEINLHFLAAPSELAKRGAASKSDTRWSRLLELRGIGHDAMDAWLSVHGGDLGRASTLRDPVSGPAR